MKKGFFGIILIICFIFLTGCGDKVVLCEISNDTYNTQMKLVVNKNFVTDVSVEFIYNDETEAKNFYEILVSQNQTDVVYKIDKNIIYLYNYYSDFKKEFDSLSISDISEILVNAGYTCN